MKSDYDGSFKKASLAHKEGRLAEAEKAYLDILREKPDSGHALNALGTVFMDRPQPGKARKVFERAANLRPPHLLACYNLGRLKQMEKDYKGAISIYKAIVKQQPRFGLAWNNLCLAYREIGEPDEAISCFRRAVAFVPDMAEAWNN